MSTIKLFFIYQLLLQASNSKNFTPRLCSIFFEPIPDILDCPSYDHIVANTDDQSINVFCRKYAQHYCSYNFSDESEQQTIWHQTVCAMPHPSINTRSGLGLLIREKIFEEYNNNCLLHLNMVTFFSSPTSHRVIQGSTGTDLI